MSHFTAVVLEHGYASIEVEREIIRAAGGELINAEDLPWPEKLKLCENADAILFRRGTITAEMIASFRRCKIIVRYGIGTDNIDREAATRHGIIVGHVPSYCLEEVADHTLALWLACVRDVVGTHEKMREGAWDLRRPLPLRRVRGRTFGIIGLGKIGEAVARRLHGWDLRIVAFDPFLSGAEAARRGANLVDFDTLIRESDYISLHVPLLPETRHLVGAPEFARMKPGSILINTSRGPVIDTEALIAGLDVGRLARVALDVFEEEPLPSHSPLRRDPRILLSDHVAWYSEESQQELQKTAAEEIARVCTGQLPRSIANPELLLKRPEWAALSEIRGVDWQMQRLERARQTAAPGND
jgi:D-3-phosphoglycerate dehydrogenase